MPESRVLKTFHFHAAKGGEKESEQGLRPGKASSVCGPQTSYTSPSYLKLPPLMVSGVSQCTGMHSCAYTHAHKTEGGGHLYLPVSDPSGSPNC